MQKGAVRRGRTGKLQIFFFQSKVAKENLYKSRLCEIIAFTSPSPDPEQGFACPVCRDSTS
jgi:hypothetical protein